MFIGVDMAIAGLVIRVLSSIERFTVENDEGSVRTLVQRAASSSPQLIMLEATGRYELLAVAIVWDRCSAPSEASFGRCPSAASIARKAPHACCFEAASCAAER